MFGKARYQKGLPSAFRTLPWTLVPPDENRPFRIERPPPTAFRNAERIARLVALLATLQFVLSGISNVVTGLPMLSIWLGSALLVGLSTLRIERYLARRRRLQ